MTDAYLHLDAKLVKAELGRLMAVYPELVEDETLHLDTIDGETAAISIIERALAEEREATIMVVGITDSIANLTARKARYERKHDAMRTLIRRIMQAALLDKITLTDATISIMKHRETVGIIDLDELPQGFFKTVRQADKTAIKDALTKGQDVPGAALVISEPSIMIRTK